MAIVRFATTCDTCSRRSEEYFSWPTCRECQGDFCLDCDVPCARTEDERHETLCKKCQANEVAA